MIFRCFLNSKHSIVADNLFSGKKSGLLKSSDGEMKMTCLVELEPCESLVKLLRGFLRFLFESSINLELFH